MKELIKKLQAEGKSVSEIALEVAKLPEAKELADDAKKLAETINTEIKAIKVSEEIEKTEKAEKADAALQAKVDAAVKATLKGMPAIKEVEKKAVKSFDHGSKKIVTSTGMSDDVKAFAEMLGCLSAKNFNRAHDINKEIASQKVLDMKALGLDTKTALYADATTGNYLFPTEVEASIFQRMYQSVMLPILNTKTIRYMGKVYPVVSQFDLEFIANENTGIGDKTPVIDNPELDMSRIGGMTYASNNLLGLTGSELIDAFIMGFGDSLARFADLFTVAASVTGNSDGFNGMVFDANAVAGTASTLANIAKSDFTELKNLLGPKFRAGAKYIANSTIRDAYGNLEDSSGVPLFKDFVGQGILKPYGKEFIENPFIPETFDIAGGDRTNGTDNVLLCINGDGIVTGFDNLTIASSEHYMFNKDQTAWRAVGRMGQKVISSAATQGTCVSYKKITA